MLTWAEKEVAKAEVKGMRDVLLHLLQQRFAPLPAAAAQRLAEISAPAELTRLADRLLTARSLEELGLA